MTRGHCSRPPRAGRHMVVHRAGVYIGDSVTYFCDTDYNFAEGGSQKTVVCRDDGTWSDAVGDCQRTCVRVCVYVCARVYMCVHMCACVYMYIGVFLHRASTCSVVFLLCIIRIHFSHYSPSYIPSDVYTICVKCFLQTNIYIFLTLIS